MGAGVARAIREKYPEAYEADLKTPRGSKKKLGTYSLAETSDGKVIYNVYSQFNLSAGIGDRATLYDMVDVGLRAVRDHMEQLAGPAEIMYEPLTLAIPYKYGCALGGGSWPIVEAIIRDIFEKSPIDVILCEWPPNVVNPTPPMSALEKALNFKLGVADANDANEFGNNESRPFTA
jgi:hypothetical protein